MESEPGYPIIRAGHEMRSAFAATVGAVLLGVTLGRIDADIPLIFLAGVPAALGGVFVSRHAGRAAGVAYLLLAIEIGSAVVAQYCQRGSDCTHAILESLLFPLIYVYALVALPLSLLISWVRNRRREVP
jgi:hypothetical protein